MQKKNFYKILPNILQNAPFLKIFSGGACPPNPPSLAPCKYPHFSKNILNPPEMKS